MAPSDTDMVISTVPEASALGVIVKLREALDPVRTSPERGIMEELLELTDTFSKETLVSKSPIVKLIVLDESSLMDVFKTSEIVGAAVPTVTVFKTDSHKYGTDGPV